MRKYYLGVPSGTPPFYLYLEIIMLQTAIFVDAGYVYAQGATCIGHPKTPRQRMRLNVPMIVDDLKAEAARLEANGRLLRIYWYDGLPRGGQPNQDQKLLAEAANVKCRFGTINSYHQQKGVDSLIVTDMIDLARGHAISDAVVFAGDEDIRVGVQVAQTYGIRVHLLGIQPAKGSQSPDLMAEADTTEEWGRNKVERWLTVSPEAGPIEPGANIAEDWSRHVISLRTTAITQGQAREIIAFADANQNQLPADFDRPSLGLAKQVHGEELSADERKQFRASLLAAVQQRALED